MTPGKMEGKVVLITGGVRGLGRAMAERMAREGAAVWITSRQSPRPDTCVEPALPGQVREMFLEVTDEPSVVGAFRQLQALHGRVDVLVNNAGIGVFKPVEETTLEEWRGVLDVNVTGAFLCSREAFRLMKGQGGGRIINISSVSGYIPIPENGAYGASKYALNGFSHILNEEGKRHGIRVSIVMPGMVLTDISKDRTEFDPADMLQPEDIAETVCDIASRPLRVRIDEVKILPPKGIL